jgi:hypothetical protein
MIISCYLTALKYTSFIFVPEKGKIILIHLKIIYLPPHLYHYVLFRVHPKTFYMLV